MYKEILVPVDGSNDSDKALTIASDLAIKCGARLHLIHVTNFNQFVLAGGGMMIQREEYESPGKAILRKAVSKAGELGNTSIESHQVDGNIAGSIVDKAEELGVDLIVIGSQGHSDIAGLLLGSISHKVCNTAQCSCLVARTE